MLGCPLSILCSKARQRVSVEACRDAACRTHHDVDLLLDFCEHPLVGNGNTLENMVRGIVHGGRGADEIDVCEATWGYMKSLRSAARRGHALAEVPLDLDGVLVDGDGLAGDKGALVLLGVWVVEGRWLGHGRRSSRCSVFQLAALIPLQRCSC